MRADRYPENPLITPADVKPSREDFEVLGTFNAGVAEYGGQVLLLVRVAERPISDDPNILRVPMLASSRRGPVIKILDFHRDDPSIHVGDPRTVSVRSGWLLTSISHLRLASSADGRHFIVDERPAVVPDRPSEAYGIEDPRISLIDGTYYIVYKSVSPNGITQSLATTKDFVTFDKRGLIMGPENMDVTIFPERINGRYAALHRPVPRMLGAPNMWVAYSPDLDHWGDHHFLMGVKRRGWASGRIGAGAVPFRTERGWVEIYHGATPRDHYCLGAVLLDEKRPHRVIARTREPILSPEAPYELHGFIPNVVFACGAIVDGDRVSLYYGAADKVMAGADLSVSEILDAMRPV
ncbi:glycosidase [candidate division KD3-62 bacterium DG_56]|uniref:Glycosidase n=1 Tax=candidate division KD3-62 bacterium DG_56 TaxID=1704032 RepID=A0A0S7XRT4_9BACT|nr:MAG: glycosidase [candidate division KD3-62 bacterium DG_56]